MSKVISRGECPRCSSSDAFTTFTEGPPKCFSCGYVHKSYPRGDKMEQYPKRDKTVDISLYSALPIKALTHKPIPVEICQRYGVRVGVDETTGDINRVYYPYHDDSNAVTGYKVRKLPKEFVSEGQVSNTKLFGQNLFDDKQRKLLIITEGEDDALSVATMLKMRGKDYPVVSISNGANVSSVGNDIKRNYEYIISHQDVMLCFDNDKVGKAYANLVAEFLCGSCNVKIVNIPEKI